MSDAKRVLAGEDSIERQVHDVSGNRWVLARILPYRLQEERLAGAVLTFVDNTERKSDEEALRERSIWLRRESQALQNAVNGAPLEISLGELVHSAAEILGDGTRAAFYLANTDKTSLHHVVGMSADYSTRVSGSGTQAECVEYIIDLTESKRAQHARRQSEERLQRVLETDAVGVIFFDFSGTLIDANEAFLKMTGYTRADIESGELNWRKLTPPEYIAESEAQMQRFAEFGKIGPYEKEYILKDGTHRWMRFAGRDQCVSGISARNHEDSFPCFRGHPSWTLFSG